MNDSRIPIFGKSIERGSDEVFKYVCCLCDRVRRYKEAKHYCGHCDILYCHDCLNDECKKGHKVVAVSDWGEESGDRCLSCRRDGRKVSRHCMDHDERCCYQCVKDKHSECEAIFEISEFAKGVYTSKDFESVSEEVVKKANDVELLTSNKKKDRRALQKSKQVSVGRLKELRKKVNDMFDKLEGDANDEINENYDEDDYRLDNDIEECENVLASLRCLRMYMESKTATDSQMFLKIEQIRERLMDFDIQLVERESSPTKFEEYEFTADPTVLCFIESIDTLKLKRHVKEPEPIPPETQNRSSTPPIMTESSTRNKNESSLEDRASGLQRATTPAATDTHSKSRNQGVLNQAEPIHKQSKRSEENPNTFLLRTNIADSEQNNHETPLGNRLKTTLSLETGPELKISMDVKIDTQLSYSKNESPNIAKTELHEERVSAKSPPASKASSEVVMKSEHEVARQECVKPKTPGRSASTPTFSKSASILPGKVSDISDMRECLSSTENIILPEQFNIRLQDDPHTCNIRGMFGLASGEILLTDSKNKKLKLINQKYKVIASCDLPARPRGVSEAGDNQAAVAMKNKTIQFVILFGSKTLKPSSCITLDHDCYGISHCNGKLYITELKGTCIYVYDTKGKSLFTISGIDMAGSSRFVDTQNVYITRDGARIYVTDALKGLVIVTPKGATLATVTQSGLLSACGVCTDNLGNVYVSGLRSHNVVKFCNRGTKMQRVVADSGVSYPMSIWFNSFKSELLVSSNPRPFGDDFLYVYKV